MLMTHYIPHCSQFICSQDPREVEASKYNLNYISMDGNIGCLGMTHDGRLHLDDHGMPPLLDFLPLW
jgi:hypothetical protein